MLLRLNMVAYPNRWFSGRAKSAAALKRIARPSRLLGAGAAALLSIAGASAQGSSQLTTDCQRDTVDPSLSYHSVVLRPGAYAGRELLIQGQVKAVVQTLQQATYLVQLSDGSQPGIQSQGTATFATGDRVCALVRVPDHWNGADNLDGVDVVSAADGEAALRALKAQAQPAPEPVVNRTGIREHYVSRPMYSRSYGSEMLPARRLLLEQYAAAVHWFNPNLPPDEARAIAGHIIWYSQVNGVDARLIIAMIAVESSFDVNATSHSGAMGLAQLMPGTARDLGVVDAYDPQQNISGAVRLLRWHLQQNMNTEDPLAMALACYNAGENAVKRYHGVPPFRETQRYVQKIKLLYSQLCQGR